MGKYKTITLREIDDLKFALAQHEGWRGNHNPDEYEEFDSWTADIKAAIKHVEQDRKKLRELLAAKEG